MAPSSPDSEPVLGALLTRIHSCKLAPQPNAEMVSLAEGLSSAPLAAFARALGSHLWNADFGAFEADAESLEGNSFHDEMVELLEPLGYGEAEAMCIGTTGGGEQALLMIADAATAGGYVIFRYAYDGVPYDNGESIERIGQFEELIRLLAVQGEVDSELHAVLSDAGLPGVEPDTDSAAAPEEEAAPPAAHGVLLRHVETPTELSADERNERFRSAYEDTRLRNEVGLAFRTKEGRVGAWLVGNHLGKYRNETLLSGVERELVFHTTEGKTTWLTGHPTDERAFVVEGGEVFEMDLRTQERARLGPKPTQLGYLQLGDRERLLTLDQADMMVRVWAHEPMQPMEASPLAEFGFGDGPWFKFKQLGADAFLRPMPTEDGVAYEVVRITETDGIQFESHGPLLLPGDEFDASRAWATRTVEGVAYILVDGGWFVL